MFQDRFDGTLIDVRVLPRSSRNVIEGVVDGQLKVRLTAAPVDGSANEALIKLLAGHFRIPKSSIVIVSGLRSRHKLVLLRGIDVAAVKARLEMRPGR